MHCLQCYSDLFNINFFIFPAVSKRLSKIRLKQQGAKKICNHFNRTKYEIITTIDIADKIKQEILRKYLNSFSDSGFSGVSSGQRTAIHKADTALIISKTV